MALDKVFKPDSQLEFICLLPSCAKPENLPQYKHIRYEICGRLDGNLWEQIELPFFARQGLLINLCNIGPLFHFDQIIYLYDASVFAVPQAYSFAFKLKYKLIFFILGRTSRIVLTTSKFSRRELARYVKIPEDKILVIYGGCDHILNIQADDSVIQKYCLTDVQYFLTVGSASAHKNVQVVEKVMENRKGEALKLVIAGGNFSRVFTEIKQEESNTIKRIGYVTDGELKSLYSHAFGLIFPSIYEGFGLPPLEAMACGCPVISSNQASLPEVCGDAVQYFEPQNIQELNDLIDGWFRNPTIKASFRQKGLERAREFTWEKAAVSLLDVISSQIQS